MLLAKPRLFKPLQRVAKHLADNSFIKVVTYNILADKYATSGWHKYVPDEYLKWEYRYSRIREELSQYDADLLCLQEVDVNAYHTQLKPWLHGDGFDSIYISRKSVEVQGPEEGSALFFRQSKLQAVATTTVMYSQIWADHTPPPLQPPYPLKLRQEAALLALLRHPDTGRLILAACTHLFWNPQFPDVKALQAHLLCAQIRSFLAANGAPADTPLVVGGDFNSLWRKYTSDDFDQIPPGDPHMTSGVYQLLSTGTLPPSHPHHPAARALQNPRHQRRRPPPPLDLHASGLQLASAYMEADGCEPPLTTRTSTFAGCLDYIWITPASLQVVEVLELPYPSSQDPSPAGVGLPPIPNVDFPSDHLAMGCMLRLL